MRAISATRWPAIAVEKAGILKPGVPAVIGPQQPEALGGDRARGPPRSARRCSSTAATGTCAPTPAGLVVEAAAQRLELPRPALAGRAPDRQCRPRRGGRPGARRGRTSTPRRSPAGLRRGALAGAAAAAGRRAGGGGGARRAVRSGSTAATTRPPARCSPRACRRCRDGRAAPPRRRHAVDQGSRPVPDAARAAGGEPALRAGTGRALGPRPRGVGGHARPRWVRAPPRRPRSRRRSRRSSPPSGRPTTS